MCFYLIFTTAYILKDKDYSVRFPLPTEILSLGTLICSVALKHALWKICICLSL